MRMMRLRELALEHTLGTISIDHTSRLKESDDSVTSVTSVNPRQTGI